MINAPHYSQATFSDASVKYGHCSVLLGNTSYVIGGRDSNGELCSDVIAQSIKGVSFIKMTPTGIAPCPREGHAAVLARNKIYVFGGLASDGTRLNDFFLFDAVENSWTEITYNGSIPAMNGHTLSYLQGKMFCIGGIHDDKPGVESSFMYEFDMDKNEWSPVITDIEPPSRWGHAVDVLEKNKIILFGGYGKYGCLNDLYCFENGQWQYPDIDGRFPIARYGHSMISIGCQLFVFGGTNLKTCFRDIWSINVCSHTSTTWQCIIATGRNPTPRAFHTAIVYYDLMLIMGGISCEPSNIISRTPTTKSPIISKNSRNSKSNDKVSITSKTKNKKIVYPFPTPPNGKIRYGDAFSNTFILDLRAARIKHVDVPTGRWETKKQSERFQLSEFDVKRTIGTGSFGHVNVCYHRPTKRHLAMKVLRKKQVLLLKQVEHVLNEKSILDQLNFPFIVNLKGSFKDKSSLYLIMEYVPGGEFFSHLRKSRRFNCDTARFYAAQVVLTFEYLHSLNVIHRDLKPENLLIQQDGFLKLTDFGFAKVVSSRTWTLCGTPEYIAPEILLSTGHSKPVDWWALGVLLFEMLTGAPPFIVKGGSPMDLYKCVLSGVVRYPPYLTKDAKDIISRFLQADISMRLGSSSKGAQSVKEHPWFEGIDFDAIKTKSVKAPWLPSLQNDEDTKYFDNYAEVSSRASSVHMDPDPFAAF